MQLKLELVSELPLVRSDENMLDQAILNLTRNGIESMQQAPPGERELTIRSRLNQAGAIEIEIADTGCGIPEAMIGNQFESFFTTKPDGLGMGQHLPLDHGVAQRPPVGDPQSRARHYLPPDTARTADMTNSTGPLVHVVDDDEALRDSLRWLLESAGHRVATYASAESFLANCDPERAGCLVLDIRLPGMSGLELQDKLKRRGHAIPIIFVTGHGDVPMAVDAVKKGALEFIEKPFNDKAFLALIKNALAFDAETRRAAARLATLTQRERKVMELIVAGKRNQDIAAKLSINIKTVEAHRANVMRKSGADSLAKLVQIVHGAGAPRRRR